MDLFDKPKEMFLFISKQKRNFDFGFLKNTFSQAQIRFMTLLTPSHSTLKLLHESMS